MTGIGGSEPRIQICRALELRQRRFQARFGTLVPMEAALEVSTIRIRILGERPRKLSCLVRTERESCGAQNVLCDLSLEARQIRHDAPVSLSPDLRLTRSVDEIDLDVEGLTA